MSTFRSRNQPTHRLRLRPRHRFWVAAITAAAFAIFFVAASSGNLSGSTFESTDGNLVKNTGTDWCNVVTSNVCTSTAPNLVEGQDLSPGSHDDSFANGTKQDDAVPSVGDGGIPNKGDLDRFYVANELLNSKNFVYLGFELLPVPNASASVHTGFEFNKLACDPVSHANCSANNVTPTRSEGDVLVVYDLEGGGNPSLSFRRWVLSGSCEISQDTAPCWGLKQTLNSTVADASLDNGADGVVDPINPGAPRTIGQYRFGEAAINLSDSGILTGCAGLGSVYTVSRSSGDSGTATMKDFIKPQKVNINNCGTIVVKKVTSPSPDTTDTSFSFTAGGGLSPTSFSLKNGDTKTYSSVNPGNGYSVAETVPGTWDLTSATCDDGSPVSNIDVSAGETVTCTFTNTEHLGAIKVTKQSTKGNSNLSGASFSITGPSFSSTIGPTGTDGTACIGNLPWSGAGTSYTVTETSAPDGYKIDNTSGVTVTVTHNASCSSGAPNAPASVFTDTPLSKIEVKFTSLAGAGVTTSQIVCKKATPSTYGGATPVPATKESDGSSGENGSGDNETTPVRDDTDEIFGNGAATGVAHTTLVPGVYTCTVDIDP